MGVPNKHLPQLDKITMLLIINFNDTPGILPRPNDPSISSFDSGVTAYDCEGDFRHDFAVFGDCFVVV
jgi:hypothetical protein